VMGHRPAMSPRLEGAKNHTTIAYTPSLWLQLEPVETTGVILCGVGLIILKLVIPGDYASLRSARLLKLFPALCITSIHPTTDILCEKSPPLASNPTTLQK